MTAGLRNNADAKGSRGVRESPQKYYCARPRGRQVDGVLSVGQSVFAQKDSVCFPRESLEKKAFSLFPVELKKTNVCVCIFFSVLVLEYINYKKFRTEKFMHCEKSKLVKAENSKSRSRAEDETRPFSRRSFPVDFRYRLGTGTFVQREDPGRREPFR